METYAATYAYQKSISPDVLKLQAGAVKSFICGSVLTWFLYPPPKLLRLTNPSLSPFSELRENR